MRRARAIPRARRRALEATAVDDRIERAMKTQAVRDPAIDKVNPGSCDRIGVRVQVAGVLEPSPRRGSCGERPGDPRRLPVVAFTGVVPQDDRREDEGERGRGGHRTRDRELRDVRADQTERVRREAEPVPFQQIGCLDRDERPRSGVDVREGRAAEGKIVIHLRGEVAAIEAAGGQPYPVDRREETAHQRAPDGRP